ncbi:DNA repair protein RecO [candidate division WWE3 bacterium RIFOXYC1_FULL_39_7]|uniref:DNA repair protein RecO n=2 Tax=Katanobacteria TaxID=422282 RepID=A0A1F4X6L7_UNCKA|nr:MAG: DNA repair protein RecO [candidate division WWE3 bacterium RIFOXYC1_FULL_39_7]OGC77308.1 MAG: DNA repair protein RecO [candidate division WWE3 bacterium RIFOXYD1_FULL_39_9]
MKQYITEAVVLKNINYGDSNKIYTLYSKEYGKISAIARGVRKLQSRRAGNLDTLNHVKVKIHEDHKGYRSIQEVNTINAFKEIKGDLALAFKSLYILELLNRFQESDHETVEIFVELLKTLNELPKKDSIPDLVIAHFEIKLMSLLGFQMYLTKCNVCSRPLDDTWEKVKFNYALGGFVCDTCRETGLPLDKKTAHLLSDLERNTFQDYVYADSKNTIQIADKIIKNYMHLVSDDAMRYSKLRGLTNL